jgi:hypothetical protein
MRTGQSTALPTDWDVAVCPVRGARAQALTVEQMADANNDPFGKPRLLEQKHGAGTRAAVVLGVSMAYYPA